LTIVPYGLYITPKWTMVLDLVFETTTSTREGAA